MSSFFICQTGCRTRALMLAPMMHEFPVSEDFRADALIG